MLEPQQLSAKIQLLIKCNGLKGRDMITKSDPFVVVYLKNGEKWQEIARTKTIQNNHDPEFTDLIQLEYKFESVQSLRFEVYDRDSNTEILSKHDFLGWFETKVSKIMGSRGSTTSGDLNLPPAKKGKAGDWGKITVYGSEISRNLDTVEFQLSANQLDRKNMFGLGKSDPFFEIKRQSVDRTSWIKVYESEYIKGVTNPSWKNVSIRMQILNYGRLEEPIRFEIYDWESSGKHKYIGAFQTTIDHLQNFSPSKQISFDIIKEKHKDKSGYKNSGVANFIRFQITKRYSFLDYIRGGCDMNLFVAVDFTGSNGDPSNPQSLHYNPMADHFSYSSGSTQVVQAMKLNDYQSAILSVGKILKDYDSDKMFPVFGFGGYFNGTTSHCFPLTLNVNNFEVPGIDGIMHAYETAIQNVQLSGPTYFTEILKQAANFARNVQPGKQKYTVLLILTDGIINDFDSTLNEIVEASYTPLSIVIVGVGNANFSNMEIFDGDNGKLKSDLTGKYAARDIVQFVPYNKFRDVGLMALSEEVLREIPGQMETFFNIQRIKPLEIAIHKPNPDENIPVAHVVAPPIGHQYS